MVIFILIGIVDSGLGAINVLNNLIKNKKYAHYILYLDYMASPYGTKTYLYLKKRLLNAINFLKEKGCKKIIIACNTLSIVAINENLNVITPIYFLQKKIEELKKNKILLIATDFTIKSNIYNCKQQAAGEIVEYLERDKKIDLNKYNELINDNDYLILGCTHFGLLFNSSNKIIDSAKLLTDNIKIKNSKLIVNIYTTKLNENIKEKIFTYLKI